MMLLKNKVVVVTGSGQGLGAAIARICAREGACVVVSDLNEVNARNVCEEISCGSIATRCDVRSDEDLARLVDTTINAFGRIDGLVNNAGVNFVKPFLVTANADWEAIINTNLRPSFFLTQLVCKHMLGQQPGGGSIVNISSVHSMAALPGSGPYDAAKFGMVGLSKSIAVEMAAHGIRVNCLSPGLLNTQIWKDIQTAAPDLDACRSYWNSNIPMQRVIEPEEIGEVAAFLLSDRSSSITGANLLADAGMTSLLVSREPYQSKALCGSRHSEE